MEFPLRFELEKSHRDDFALAPALSNDYQKIPEFPCAEYREDTHPKRLLDDISSDAGSKVPLLLKSALKSDTSRKLGIAKPRRKRVKFTVDTHKSTASRTSTPLSKRLKILALDLDRLDGLPDIIFRSTNKQKTRRTRHLKSYIRFGIKDVAMLRATQEQETMVDQAILKCLREFKKDPGQEVTCTMFTHPSEKDLQTLPYEWQPMQAEYPPSFTMEGTLAAFPKHSLSESYCYQSDIPRSGSELVGHLSDAFAALNIHRFD
ncbi:uncharacterized protein LOC112565225 [Pomacea canaliculata]|uniref:uncharacterized protein LOC112565225 n=1 Tax=Pomacea canaliculata TaxID=400727 RepID=UPI000D73EDE2|nr:uncharacterized protein LOC112565225 [Pomacea canaliculata]